MFFPHFRNEIWKLFGKPRTHLGFLMFILAQNVLVLIFRFSPAFRQMQRTLEGNGYVAANYLSVLTTATVMLVPMAYMLLPLYTALVGGDLVAKEVEDGTLRMILCRPISRARLLLVKWLAGACFASLLALALGGLGLFFAYPWFPWGGLFVYQPGELFGVFDATSGLERYVCAVGLMSVKACTIMGLALMFSCFNLKPAAATILALSFIFLNFILMSIPFFKDLQPWFLTYHLNLWQLILSDPIPWSRILSSLCLLAAFNLSFLVIGLAGFHVRDIKS